MAKTPSSSSKLLVMMLFSFLALFIISHARVVFTDTPSNSYAPPIYAPVPKECLKPPYCRGPPGESQFVYNERNYYQIN
ncbi:hypothetical protein AtNW77_Chr1g0078891 [Arabidopsis thaliana]|uniref:At1g76955 n=3 Tax=Arabidopsis TaxID=3701 RepID=Q0V819_ARATH|nr:uncharacterized protein AT1G76955 [Arabidopsis thaliana]KAG7651969.1 hypothetical protein ISN45_At01g067770 [Arabidopsis thaliana x Arabidopsis arenosa]ABH04508.1 At1g76955 [Arabidopsis thaliana]AEE35911.1 Expressed protein [Arabidopsis thaliana]OAP14373.1 hypothetical protein AXX17_AT1G71480 [Arabidopsis thaliana]VYS51269.1 unnamed protein product [Arabidopsis thaliana]|eukprot:NP_974159.1 Expressed protein [Arabidopsis thaliana]